METAVAITSSSFADLGLGAFVNWQYFLVPYFLEDTVAVAKYTTAWNFGDLILKDFIDSLRSQIETQFFDSAFADLLVTDMLDGYETEYASRVNGGDYWKGNDFSLSSMTQPIRNDVMGFQSNVSYGEYTGSNGIDEIGRLRIINGESYVNRIVELFNGTAYNKMTQNDPRDSLANEKLSGTSAGMQFPPDVQEDD